MGKTSDRVPSTGDDERQKVLDDAQALKASKRRAPDLKMDLDEDTNALTIQFDSDDAKLAHALAKLQMGTGDDRVFMGLLSQITNVGANKESYSEEAANFVLGVIAGIEPQDEVEAMLATQMAVTHQATMMMAKRLNHVETIPQQDSAERALNKLARTFATQTKALKKYRTKARQTVRVERVTVNDDGQAIVGSVSHEGEGNGKT